MPRYVVCPFFNGHVEVTEEREEHIRSSHLEAALALLEALDETVRSPDLVLRRSEAESEWAFVRALGSEAITNYALVIVVRDRVGSESGTVRHWVVTAYIARRLPRWRVEWQRS